MYLLAYMVLGGEEEDQNILYIFGLYGIGRRGGGLNFLMWWVYLRERFQWAQIFNKFQYWEGEGLCGVQREYCKGRRLRQVGMYCTVGANTVADGGADDVSVADMDCTVVHNAIDVIIGVF